MQMKNYELKIKNEIVVQHCSFPFIANYLPKLKQKTMEPAMTTPQVDTQTNSARPAANSVRRCELRSTNSVQRAANSVRRAAFTLVELMIVILIIGILAGIATPVIFNAMRRAKEFTIENEIQQMSAAADLFETKYGFYPPSIGAGKEISGPATLRRYLNKIAPNNAEASSGGLTAWWNNVGMNLDDRSSLVFWLSGMCTNKQFPLSGNATFAAAGTSPAPYNADELVDGTAFPSGTKIAREVLFEFKSGQFESVNPALPGIKIYNQPHGRDDMAYRYRDFKSYTPKTGGSGPAYHNGVDTGGSPINFFNQDRFQIVSPGLDGTLSDNPTPVTDLMDDSQGRSGARRQHHQLFWRPTG